MDERYRLWERCAGRLKRRDAKLAPLIREIGPPRPRFHEDPFLALSRAILSQQLAPRAAAAIWARFHERCKGSPHSVARLSEENLRALGVSARKALYLRTLARAFLSPSWRRALSEATDAQVRETLVALPGIGNWTVDMFLIFCLGRTDVLPVGDYGVRRGVGLLLGTKAVPSEKELPALVAHWSGAESVGSWYLWKALDRGLLK